jgi:L,D-transpeptidase YcbB
MRPAFAAIVSLGALIASSHAILALETGSPEVPAAAPTAVAPVEAPSPAFLAIRDRLADRKAGLGDSTIDERKAVSALYEARAGAPLFAGQTGLTTAGAGLLAELKLADDWGLPSVELVPSKLPGANVALTAAEVADAEVKLALAALKYARFARGSRISDPTTQLATYIDRKPQLADPKAILDMIASSGAPDATLRGFHPPHPAFEALRKAYNEARQSKANGNDDDAIPDGPSLKPGVRHSNVALVRATLKVAPVPAADGKAPDPSVYDPALAAAVAAFQTSNGLEPADGIVGPKTRAALNSLKPPSAAKLLANMEQWRWMPADLGETYIHVNIPEFTLRMVKNGAVIHSERVVTGLVTNQTPLFCSPTGFCPKALK